MNSSERIRLTVVGCPEKKLAFTNQAFVNPETFKKFKEFNNINKATTAIGDIRCQIKTIIVNVTSNTDVPSGAISLNQTHRVSSRVNLDDIVIVEPWIPQPSVADVTAQEIKCEIGTIIRSQHPVVYELQLERLIQTSFKEHVFTVGQTFAVQNPSDNITLSVAVTSIERLALTSQRSLPNAELMHGIVMGTTEITCSVAEGFHIKLINDTTRCKSLFRTEFDFQRLGVGGLDTEFANIFRRAFASRIFPPSIVKELGIQHVRGMLLYGPPGTGKTLIARQISQALRAREPKIVNGPEILNKYVGQSEENIRALFKDAEDEYKKKGDSSSLHIIILDEIDAICRQRGSPQSGTGVNDSVVNQLLSKIDGVDSLNNILLIGMTNRLDMIDDALLRPGRLEVHIEIGLPDFNGRIQILNIHTDKMRQSNRLAEDVSLPNLADRTRNFSGAEIAGLIRSAASYAFTRNVDAKDLSRPHDVSLIQLCQADFNMALEEIKPAFGAEMDQLKSCLLCGIIEYSSEFKDLKNTLYTFAHQVRDSTRTPLLSCLLLGEPGSGKTALAAYTASLADFPFVKFISPEQFVGFTEFARTTAIKAVFEDAYKSELSIIILDNLERLLDYTALGSRFSNMILQALLVLIKKIPTKKTHRLLVLATSSEPQFMENSGVAACFNIVLNVPLLSARSHIKTVLKEVSDLRNNLPEQEIDYVCQNLKHSISIKQLLLVYEMATEACRNDTCVRGECLLRCINDCGVMSNTL